MLHVKQVRIIRSMEDPAKRRPSGTPLDGNRSKSVDRKKDTEPKAMATTMSQAGDAKAGGAKGPSSKGGADKSQDKDAEVPSEPREAVVMGKRSIHARAHVQPTSAHVLSHHPLFISTLLTISTIWSDARAHV